MSSSSVLSTYRLQLNAGFRFDDAAALIPYFATLGITHLYLSPIWTARPKSNHGYDICDHSKINPELGGEEAFNRLSETAAAHSIGIILDFVPNHMCADSLYNLTWRDLLCNGPSSAYAEYFDVDWQPVKDELQNKVLLPILGRQYGEALEAGELQIAFEDGEFCLRYWDHNLPLNPRQCRLILRHREVALTVVLEDQPEVLQEYLSILFQLDHLPSYTDVSPDARNDRQRELSIATQRLVKLMETSEEVRRHVAVNVEEYNGRVGDPSSFDLLHELLELQAYRLTYWRTALHEINYRRFFDINELAGLRMESAEVFEYAHAKAFELIRSGRAHGLRLDHIDGLYDPTAYLKQLRLALNAEAPQAYVVVEKILSTSEPLSSDWPVDGTTGYEYLNQVSRLYVHPANLEQIRRIYHHFARRSLHYEDIGYTSKQQIITTSMASELNVLAHELNRMSEDDRLHRDFTLDSLQEALREVVACFPVYRTYISERGILPSDRRAVDEAIRRAVARNPVLESSIFSFIREFICPEQRAGEDDRSFERRMRFVLKFQQYTGPVQAKGIEDTTFYRYCPLASLNEVGGEPAQIGSPVTDFHAANMRRQTQWPRSMITTSTHDTKRGEDARVRISVLSELPDEWRKNLRTWSRIAASGRTKVDGHPAPDRNDEYLFYQSLLAIWPVRDGWANEMLLQRVLDYMSKAVKEAKTHSSWINPVNEYDAATARFVEYLLTSRRAEAFRESFAPFATKVARFGALNSLSQLTLKLASPGVVDFYQGSEFWDLTLVDADNRRPVNFEVRKQWLAEWERQVVDGGDVFDFARLNVNGDQGEIKAALMAIGLDFRRKNPELMMKGSYRALDAAGPLADHAVAFTRRRGDQILLVAGLRWMVPLIGEKRFPDAALEWSGTRIPLPDGLAGRTLRNLFTNEQFECTDSVAFHQLFRYLPGAFLTVAA